MWAERIQLDFWYTAENIFIMCFVSFTDYKFLGIMKAMFPDVPILGLTATSTSRITVDVQKMLNIQGCLVLKASFNRPNIYYEVWNADRNE
jgi:superfamily II DNA helicase RecQ